MLIHIAVRSVVYSSQETILHNVTLPAATILPLIAELDESNLATFLFTVDRCLLVRHETGGKDWFSIAGKYDKNVQDYSGREKREALLRDIESGKVDIIKVTVCSEPESVDGEIDFSARRIFRTIS